MPRIISEEVFMKAQRVKGKKQRQNEQWGDFALSGRVICSACGRNMRGVSGRGSSKRKYEYYACAAARRSSPSAATGLRGRS